MCHKDYKTSEVVVLLTVTANQHLFEKIHIIMAMFLTTLNDEYISDIMMTSQIYSSLSVNWSFSFFVWTDFTPGVV